MTRPADLVAHYSSKALQTRIYALTFVGAVMGATLLWLDQPVKRNLLGLALLAVVGSLAELNRRYTYSYRCACVAEARAEAGGDSEDRVWNEFVAMNEGPWSNRKGVSRTLWRGAGNRFLLSWATYLPGLFAGALLSWLDGFLLSRVLGATLSAVLLIWWVTQSARRPVPVSYLDPVRDATSESGSRSGGLEGAD